MQKNSSIQITEIISLRSRYPNAKSYNKEIAELEYNELIRRYNKFNAHLQAENRQSAQYWIDGIKPLNGLKPRIKKAEEEHGAKEKEVQVLRDQLKSATFDDKSREELDALLRTKQTELKQLDQIRKQKYDEYKNASERVIAISKRPLYIKLPNYFWIDLDKYKIIWFSFLLAFALTAAVELTIDQLKEKLELEWYYHLSLIFGFFSLERFGFEPILKNIKREQDFRHFIKVLDLLEKQLKKDEEILDYYNSLFNPS